jgi:hypothetical protein
MTMDYYAGIDVSLEASSLCVVDASGKIVKEAKLSSEPEAAGMAASMPGVLPCGKAEGKAPCRNGGDPLAGRRPFGVDALARKGGSFVSLIGGRLSDSSFANGEKHSRRSPR